jgi:hypothetical protein
VNACFVFFTRRVFVSFFLRAAAEERWAASGAYAGPGFYQGATCSPLPWR